MPLYIERLLIEYSVLIFVLKYMKLIRNTWYFSTGDPTQQDMDIILLLSQRAYYVACYDDELDQVTNFQKIYLENLEKIEIGEFLFSYN